MADEEAPKRGRGRPLAADTDEKRDRQVLIRISDAEHKAIESAAAGAGTTVSGFIRSAALDAIGESPADVDRAELALLRAEVAELREQRERARTRLRYLAEALE